MGVLDVCVNAFLLVQLLNVPAANTIAISHNPNFDGIFMLLFIYLFIYFV
jgi:hypothetical protein